MESMEMYDLRNCIRDCLYDICKQLKDITKEIAELRKEISKDK